MDFQKILKGFAIAAVLSSPTLLNSAHHKCHGKCKGYYQCGAKCGAKCGANISRPNGYIAKYISTPENISAGKKMFNSTKLSTNGMSCATCHSNLKSYSISFKENYPHHVNMASSNYGKVEIYLDEAIQMCMNGPMKAELFEWGSKDLNNLTVFMQEEHKAFKKKHK